MGKMMQVNKVTLWHQTIRWWMILRGVMLGMPSTNLSSAIAQSPISRAFVPLQPLASAQQHPAQIHPSPAQPPGLSTFPGDDTMANLREPSLESCLPRRTKAELDRLLDIRNTNPARVTEIDRQIHQLFAETHAVMVLDMSGFSLRTLRLGIIPTLAVIKRLQTEIVPIITRHQGSIVKLEADNVFAVFPEVQDAVEGAIAIHQHLLNTDLRVSIGIGYGEILMIAEEDMFGTELNLASKLGEDLAEPGETMITEMAFQRLNRHGLTTPTAPTISNWEQLEIAISGIQMLAYKLQTAAVQPK